MANSLRNLPLRNFYPITCESIQCSQHLSCAYCYWQVQSASPVATLGICFPTPGDGHLIPSFSRNIPFLPVDRTSDLCRPTTTAIILFFLDRCEIIVNYQECNTECEILFVMPRDNLYPRGYQLRLRLMQKPRTTLILIFSRPGKNVQKDDITIKNSEEFLNKNQFHQTCRFPV